MEMQPRTAHQRVMMLGHALNDPDAPAYSTYTTLANACRGVAQMRRRGWDIAQAYPIEFGEHWLVVARKEPDIDQETEDIMAIERELGREA